MRKQQPPKSTGTDKSPGSTLLSVVCDVVCSVEASDDDDVEVVVDQGGLAISLVVGDAEGVVAIGRV